MCKFRIFYFMILIVACNKDINDSKNIAPSPDCNNAIIVNPVQFCIEHTENVVKASDFYANKAIQISAKITSIQNNISINFKDTIIQIGVFDNNSTCSFYFDLDKSQRERIKLYVQGDTITLCGLYNEAFGWLFHFKNSIIIR